MMTTVKPDAIETRLSITPISFSASYLTKNQAGIYLEGGNYLYAPVIYYHEDKTGNASSFHHADYNLLLINFEEVLKQVKEKWDHYTYLPLKARYFSFHEDETHYKCRWNWKKKKMKLSLPKNECLLLPTSQITLKDICRLITIDYFSALKLMHPTLLSSVRQVKGILQGTHGTVSVVIQESPTVITAT